MVIQPRQGGREVRGLVHFQNLIESIYGGGTYGGITFTKNENGTYRLTGTQTVDTGSFRNINDGHGNACKIYHRHTYVLIGYVKTYTKPTTTKFRVYWGSTLAASGMESDSVRTVSADESISANTWARFQIKSYAGAEYDCDAAPMLFDLTDMFSDCPELTPTSVAEFKALFPADYYPYTEQPYDVII